MVENERLHVCMTIFRIDFKSILGTMLPRFLSRIKSKIRLSIYLATFDISNKIRFFYFVNEFLFFKIFFRRKITAYGTGVTWHNVSGNCSKLICWRFIKNWFGFLINQFDWLQHFVDLNWYDLWSRHHIIKIACKQWTVSERSWECMNHLRLLLLQHSTRHHYLSLISSNHWYTFIIQYYCNI